MKILFAVLCVTLGLVFAPAAQADTYNWADPLVGGEWTTDTNWTEADYPNGVGDRANIAVGTEGVFDVNVASPITVGQIIITPTTGGAMDDKFLSNLTGSGDGQITFNNDGAVNVAGANGALIKMDSRNNRTPANTTWSVPMVLDDDLLMKVLSQRDRRIDSTISGTGALTFDWGFSPVTIGGASPNTYSGGTTIKGTSTFVLTKDGALGTGDVKLSDHRSGLRITNIAGDEDRIADSASLYLTTNGTLYSKVTLDTGVFETVGGLYFDGFQQSVGTWGSSSSNANNTNDDWFGGSGVLNVIPEPGTIALLGLAGLVMLIRRRFVK